VGSKAKRLALAESSPAKWHVINYEGLLAAPSILALDWGAVVLDESTRIKNPKADITKLLNRGAGCALMRLTLTGCPAPEGPLDYCEQMRFTVGDMMGHKNYWDFRKRWFRPDWTGHGWDPKPGTFEAIKRWVDAHALVLTRKQAGIGSKKVREVRWIEMGSKQRAAYNQCERRWIGESGDKTKWAPVAFTWLSRMAGGFNERGERLPDARKASELINLLKGELSQEQVVVWFRFNAELAECRRRLIKKGVKCYWMTGATSLEKRRDRVAGFQAGERRVMLCQVKVGKYGLDLSAADTAIYYSNTYSCEDRLQSEDRIVHPKKRATLLYVDLVTKGTVDEDCAEALRGKIADSQAFASKLAIGILKRRKK